MIQKIICYLPFTTHNYVRYKDLEDDMLDDSWGHLHCKRCNNGEYKNLNEFRYTLPDE